MTIVIEEAVVEDCHNGIREAVKKIFFFSGIANKAYTPPPPPRLSGRRIFFVLKQPETDFDIFSPQFLPLRPRSLITL